MSKVAIGLAVLLAGGFIAWRVWQMRQTPPPPPKAMPLAPAPVVVADAQPVPQIQHPVEKVSAAPRAKLPPLDDSDIAIHDKLADLFGTKKLVELFILDGMIRRIVATVDSLPREQVAPSLWPLKPVPGEFAVDKAAGTLALGPKNFTRYTSRVKVAESLDPKKVAAVYLRFYPLFQQAYRDLGYPQGYFNDRLVEVIDHLLSTPEPAQPMRLTQPHVRYEYADADLQGRSAGQKMLFRMGPQNAASFKGVLRELRREITR
jgi:hypothetical protein